MPRSKRPKLSRAEQKLARSIKEVGATYASLPAEEQRDVGTLIADAIKQVEADAQARNDAVSSTLERWHP